VDNPGPSAMVNETFNHQKAVERQEGVCSGGHIFMCDICNTAFLDKNVLKRHVRIHSEERPYACDVLSCSALEHRGS
jgi:KRAB domain-containing zinc finger protein